MQWSAATAVCRNRTVDKNRDRTRMQWYCGTGVCIHSFVVCIVYVNEWRDVMTSIATLCGYFALDSSFASCVIVLSVMHCTYCPCMSQHSPPCPLVCLILSPLVSSQDTVPHIPFESWGFEHQLREAYESSTTSTNPQVGREGVCVCMCIPPGNRKQREASI